MESKKNGREIKAIKKSYITVTLSFEPPIGIEPMTY
jgi:hypothetical protein